MKKLLASVLAVMLIAGLFVLAASAVDPHEIKWSFEEGTLEPFTTDADWGEVSLIQSRDTDRNDGVTPMDKDGTYFLCTVFFENGEDYDEVPMGSINSPTFYIYNPVVNVLIGGGGPQNYVAVCRASDGEELASMFNPLLSGHPFQDVEIDLGDNYTEGEAVYVKIVDGTTGGWGFISVDNIRAHGILESEMTEEAAPAEEPAAEPAAPVEVAETAPVVTAAPQTFDALGIIAAVMLASGTGIILGRKKR